MLRKYALILFAVGGVSHLILGLVYVTADEFMSYHGQALLTDWGSLDSNYKTLLLALIRLAGAGALVTGLVNLALVIYFFRRGYSTLIWLLPVTALTFQLVTNYVVYSVYVNTPGEPPLVPVSLGTVVLLLATTLLIAGMRGKHEQ